MGKGRVAGPGLELKIFYDYMYERASYTNSASRASGNEAA